MIQPTVILMNIYQKPRLCLNSTTKENQVPSELRLRVTKKNRTEHDEPKQDKKDNVTPVPQDTFETTMDNTPTERKTEH